MKPSNKILGILIVSMIMVIVGVSGVMAQTITINDAQSVGVIRSDFYGANTGGRFLAGDGATYGTKITGTSTYLNVTELRNAWTDAGLNLRRYDMNLYLFYSNTTDPSGVNMTGNLTQIKEDIHWAFDNNQKVMLIANKMPTFLGDRNNDLGLCQNNNQTCPPTNYTIWGNIVVDFINQTTNGGQWVSALYGIEGWNEPDFPAQLLFNLTSTDTNSLNRSKAFVNIYNATYLAVKAYNSSIKVGGFGNLYDATQSRKFFNYTLNSIYNKIDFISYHQYMSYSVGNANDGLSYSTLLDRDYSEICGNYTTLLGYCPQIALSEWNLANSTVMNYTSYSNEYKSVLSDAFIWALNKRPYNWSFVMYQFSEQSNYTSGNRYQMFTGSQLDNWTSPSYTLTKTFATNHKAGNTVVNATSTDSDIKVVASKDLTKEYITLTNTNSSGKTNVLITGLQAGTNSLVDVNTGEYYSAVLGMANIPTLDGYEVQTLQSSGLTPLSITNTPSGTITIQGHTAQINSTIDSLNKLDTVQTNLSGVITNIRDPSLILCYNFDNVSALNENDTFVYDDCGGNNGSVKSVNASVTNGKYNLGYNFNQGAKGYIDGGNFSGANLTTSFTTSFWVNPNYNFNSSTRRTFVGFGLDDGSQKSWSVSYLVGAPNGIEFQSGHNDTQRVYSQNTILQIGQWYHIAVSYNNNNVSIYLNGALIKNGIMTGSIRDISSKTFTVGSFGTGQFTNATMDEIRVWNRTLSQNEISQSYYCSLNKINATQYKQYCNESITGTSKTFSVSANDTLNNQNSASNFISRIQSISTTSILSGIVNSIFYGVNYNSNGGGLSTADTYNSQSAFLNSKFKIIRLTIFLENKVNNDFTIKSGTSVTQDRDTIKFAHDNGLKIQLIAKNMPTFTQNTSSPLCGGNGLSCPAIDGNYSLFAKSVVAYITNMTNGGLWSDTIDSVEVWNEPDTSFLNTTASGNDNQTLALEYIKMFNETYNQVKATYPNIRVVGASSSSKSYVNYINTYLSNRTTNIDGATDHMYWRAPPNGIVRTLLQDSNNLTATCNIFGANCSMIYANEWNLNIDDHTSYTPFHASGTGANYADMLNNYANTSSVMLYTWSNSDNFSIYNVSGGNTYPYSPYLVTSNFTRYCPTGWNVYNTSNNYGDAIVQVYCVSQDGKSKGLITVNLENDQQNVSISNLSANSLWIDVNSGNLLTADSNGNLNYGVLDNYSVTYLTTPNLTLQEGTGLIKQNYLGENIGTGNEIYFTVSSDTVKHISSNLSVPTTATISFNVASCELAQTITYTPNGSSSQSFNKGSYTCANNVATLNSVTINPSVESNVIQISYGSVGTGVCATLLNLHTFTAGQLVLVFILVIFGVLFAIVFGIMNFTSTKTNPYALVTIFIVMLIGAILLAISALITTSLCAL